MLKILNWKNNIENKIMQNRQNKMLVYSTKNKHLFASGLCFTKLFYLFFIGCFVGTILETFWYFLLYKKFEICVGLVYGPFIPIYGGGACILTILLYKMYKYNNFVIFIAGTIIGASFEFLCSFIQEKAFGTIAWNYSGTPLNIGGRTNLMYGIIWGILCLFWVRWLYPILSTQIEKIPVKIGKIITIFLVIFMVCDVAISCFAAKRWNERNKGILPANSFEEYIDKNLDDEYMQRVYPHTRFIN